MNPPQYTITRWLVLAALVLFLSIDGGDGLAVNEATPECSASQIQSVSNAPLAEYRISLLDRAFEIASSIPKNPHSKDRSRAQEAVVSACLQLDQPLRAAIYAERIDDWRRGLCYADLAIYWVQRGYTEEAQKNLHLAESISATTEDWRRDRIRIKMAQTYMLLGKTERAEQYATGVVDSEIGKLAQVKTRMGEDDSFDKQLDEIHALLATGNYDIVKNSLEACTHLFHRFYSDPERRNRVEETIQSSWNLLPIRVRYDLVTTLAGFALNHSDTNKTHELVNQAQAFLDKYQWPLDHRIPMTATVAVLLFQVGEKEKSRSELETLRARFREDRNKIVNIYRAGALRPLAQAYRSIGDTESALIVYKLAIEEGMENPNSRPRAEDLSATCLSMAVTAIEPDSQLWERIHQIEKGLGQPW